MFYYMSRPTSEADPKAGDTTQYVLMGKDFWMVIALRLSKVFGSHTYIDNDLGLDHNV